MFPWGCGQPRKERLSVPAAAMRDEEERRKECRPPDSDARPAGGAGQKNPEGHAAEGAKAWLFWLLWLGEAGPGGESVSRWFP